MMEARMELNTMPELTGFERAHVLQNRINTLVKQGWMVERQTQITATLMRKAWRLHPAVTITLIFMTGGLLWPVFLFWKKTQRLHLYVDARSGEVHQLTS